MYEDKLKNRKQKRKSKSWHTKKITVHIYSPYGTYAAVDVTTIHVRYTRCGLFFFFGKCNHLFWFTLTIISVLLVGGSWWHQEEQDQQQNSSIVIVQYSYYIITTEFSKFSLMESLWWWWLVYRYAIWWWVGFVARLESGKVPVLSWVCWESEADTCKSASKLLAALRLLLKS